MVLGPIDFFKARLYAWNYRRKVARKGESVNWKKEVDEKQFSEECDWAEENIPILNLKEKNNE